MKPNYLICNRCYRRWNVSRLRDNPRPYLCPFCRKIKAPPPVDQTGGGKKKVCVPIIGQKVRFVK